MCLKINYPFFIENSAGRLVSRSLRFHIYMILNDVCFFFLQSIWIVDLTNESAKFVTNAISWCQWFSSFSLVCLYSECDKFQSNFVLVMYPCLGHVLFIYSFFVGSQMQNSHIQIFLWQTMGLVNHSICREKKFHSYENDGQQNLPFLHKKDNIHSHSHTPTIWMLFFSLLCERSENSVQQRAELETKQFVWKV